MTILRVYDPAECDERGVPLDWERCRTCEETGRYRDPRIWGTMPGSTACEVCDGHGSLRAAALAEKLKISWDYPGGVTDVSYRAARCEDCGHPMSEGTWEYDTSGWRSDDGEWYEPAHPMAAHVRLDEHAIAVLHEGREPTMYGVHYSPCDEGCRHDGPDRLTAGEHVRNGQIVRATWRPVDVRPLGWPHDLRPERLAVLCLRCYTERTP